MGARTSTYARVKTLVNARLKINIAHACLTLNMVDASLGLEIKR